DKCKDAAYWDRRPLRRCKGCGVTYRGRTTACSESCYHRIRYRKWLHCARCYRFIRRGEEIVPNADSRTAHGVSLFKPGVVFCSEQCRDVKAWCQTGKVCVECGDTFYPATTLLVKRQRFCSHRCGDRYRKR